MSSAIHTGHRGGEYVHTNALFMSLYGSCVKSGCNVTNYHISQCELPNKSQFWFELDSHIPYCRAKGRRGVITSNILNKDNNNTFCVPLHFSL